jgi:MHS family proline/betaine transporter-like MFS transporter
MKTERSEEPAATRRIIAAGIIGNVLEWYDFAIYGYFATAIGRSFFPQEDALAQLLAAFGVFAVGYLMRPIGGVLIGHIGDRYGRRTALTVSVSAMAIPTFLIGLLPGYAAIGVAAPIALTLLRMVQGLSVGGEYTSSMVFLVERAPASRRGVMGALSSCGASGGILLGSATGAIFSAAMSSETLDAWGWRLPFLLGLIVGLAGYLLRRHLQETVPDKRGTRPPIIDTLRSHRGLVLALAGLSMFNAVPFYVGFVYLVSWLQTVDGFAPARALEINSISMALLLPVLILGGLASDRLGRKPLLLTATLIGLIGAVPAFWLLHHPSLLLAQLGQLILVVMIGLFCGAQPSFMVEAAPSEVRCTAVALGYNLTLGIIGGLTPLAATWLVGRTGDELAPAYLIMAAALIAILAITSLRDTYRAPLSGTTPIAAE